jgi:hypothetical protein
MALMVLCGLLLLAGIAAVARWGGGGFDAPASREAESQIAYALSARRFVGYLTVGIAAGLGAGLVAAAAWSPAPWPSGSGA